MQSFLATIESPDAAMLAPPADSAFQPFTKAEVSAAAKSNARAIPQLNPNDPALILELRHGASAGAASALQHARCPVAPPPTRAGPAAAATAIVPGDRIAEEFARFNVSSDAHYKRQRRGRVAGIASGAAMLHSPIAANLSQLPLPAQLTRSALLRPHRPLHKFMPESQSCAIYRRFCVHNLVHSIVCCRRRVVL